jgi:hypothetical protein
MSVRVLPIQSKIPFNRTLLQFDHHSWSSRIKIIQLFNPNILPVNHVHKKFSSKFIKTEILSNLLKNKKKFHLKYSGILQSLVLTYMAVHISTTRSNVCDIEEISTGQAGHCLISDARTNNALIPSPMNYFLEIIFLIISNNLFSRIVPVPTHKRCQNI